MSTPQFLILLLVVVMAPQLTRSRATLYFFILAVLILFSYMAG